VKVFILGRGKVGAALATAAKKAGHRVRVQSARSSSPGSWARKIDCDLAILAVRDAVMPATIAALIAAEALPATAVVVHAAGARGAEFLEALRPHVAGVAQMHPMISFADPAVPPTLARGNMRVSGDAAAVKVARAFARSLGMTPRELGGADPVGYHAAAALVANGAAALAAVGVALLEVAGVSVEDAPKMLGPLLRSVAENVENLGLPGALTGPVRRGDAAGVAKHEALVADRLPEARPLYRALVAAQLPLARALPDATPEQLAALDALVASWK
jgi:predicted short-subunit dehydrogenase-like oxidoreductase (DUF2520 family)